MTESADASSDGAIRCIIDVMSAGLAYADIRRAVHIHPTASLLTSSLLRELQPLP